MSALFIACIMIGAVIGGVIAMIVQHRMLVKRFETVTGVFWGTMLGAAGMLGVMAGCAIGAFMGLVLQHL